MFNVILTICWCHHRGFNFSFPQSGKQNVKTMCKSLNFKDLLEQQLIRSQFILLSCCQCNPFLFRCDEGVETSICILLFLIKFKLETFCKKCTFQADITPYQSTSFRGAHKNWCKIKSVNAQIMTDIRYVVPTECMIMIFMLDNFRIQVTKIFVK